MPKTPGYRKRHDRNQAIVTLTDAVTKRRKDYWLGEHGSPESREMYHRVIAEWEANGRRLPDIDFDAHAGGGAGNDAAVTVSTVCARFLRVRGTELDESERSHVRALVRLLRRSYGSTPAATFGPRRLYRLREEMVRGDTTGETGRRAWSAGYTNAQVRRLCRVFRWAASRELIPASVHRALLTVDPLRPGRSGARPPRSVKPVADVTIKATLPFMASPVRALVQLQRLTGARPDELLGLRPCDIDASGADGVWVATPRRHKTQHTGRRRAIHLGPRAQEILGPFMGRDPDAYLFSPAEADLEKRARRAAARRTPLSCGNRAGTNRRAVPRKTAGDRYTPRSYYRAIQYACDQAFPPPPPLAKGESETREAWRERIIRDGLKPGFDEWRRKHRWFPYQLRHAAATALRREHGLEVSALVLGHASARVTDAVYAERDQSKVAEIMRRVG